MKNKKVLIGIIVVVVIILGAIGFGVYKVQYNAKQLALLTEETNKLSKMDISKDTIDKDVKTEGDYAVVEETIKNYLGEVQTVYNGITELCTSSDLTNILSADNIKEDGPEFATSKEKMSTFRTQLNDYLEQCNTLLDTNNIMSKIQEKGLSEYYNELYKTLFMTDSTSKDLETTKKNLASAVETVNTTLDGVEKTLNFLTENKDNWSVADGKIQFTNVKALTEYNKLITSLR